MEAADAAGEVGSGQRGARRRPMRASCLTKRRSVEMRSRTWGDNQGTCAHDQAICAHNQGTWGDNQGTWAHEATLDGDEITHRTVAPPQRSVKEAEQPSLHRGAGAEQAAARQLRHGLLRAWEI